MFTRTVGRTSPQSLRQTCCSEWSSCGDVVVNDVVSVVVNDVVRVVVNGVVCKV